MRGLAAVVLALGGAWLVLRNRRADGRRVLVGWQDGSELELRSGSPERERLVAVAREALA